MGALLVISEKRAANAGRDIPISLPTYFIV
jgi:hypothetical protein